MAIIKSKLFVLAKLDEKLRKSFRLLYYMIPLFSLIVALFTSLLQIKSNQAQFGGSLKASYQSQPLKNGGYKTIVVWAEESIIDVSDVSLTPSFENPSKYSLKDFSLSFDAECENVTITPSVFVVAYNHGKNNCHFNYSQNLLAAYNDTKNPFSYMKFLGEEGHCVVKTKVSYNGAPSAFEYVTNVWLFAINNVLDTLDYGTKDRMYRQIFQRVDDDQFDAFVVYPNKAPQYYCNIIRKDFLEALSSENVRMYGSLFAVNEKSGELNDLTGEQNPMRPPMKNIILSFILSLLFELGVIHLVANIILFLRSKFYLMRWGYWRFGLRDALKHSTFCLFPKHFVKFESKKLAIAYFIGTILTILSPITLFLSIILYSTF